MGRSVSVPYNAVVVCYQHIEYVEEYDGEEFDFLIEKIREDAKAAFPSLYSTDNWIGREDHAILANDYAYIGVSEYCGIVAIWVVPKDDNGYSGDGSRVARALHWCNQIRNKFNKLFGELSKVGTFSNGEAVFQKTA